MTPALSWKERLRPLRASAWLGFQIESNWSDPIVFAVYALAKPLATSLILLAMYKVVIGGSVTDPKFASLYLGNSLYVFVNLLLVGLSWAVFEDREQYRTLKYVATTPIGLTSYLLGRSLTKFVLATISAILVLAFGIGVLGLRFAVSVPGVLALIASLAVGAVGIVAVGLVLAGCAMVFARQSMMMNEGVSAVLYLFCGVVFPPDLLSAFLQPVALALPMTYWLEASRRSLGVHDFSAILSRLTDLQLAAIFVAIALAWLFAARWIFGRLERRARSEGLLDITTAW